MVRFKNQIKFRTFRRKDGRSVVELVSTAGLSKTMLALAGMEVKDAMIGENLLDGIENR